MSVVAVSTQVSFAVCYQIWKFPAIAHESSLIDQGMQINPTLSLQILLSFCYVSSSIRFTFSRTSSPLLALIVHMRSTLVEIHGFRPSFLDQGWDEISYLGIKSHKMKRTLQERKDKTNVGVFKVGRTALNP